jgi:hypothetical protein
MFSYPKGRNPLSITKNLLPSTHWFVVERISSFTVGESSPWFVVERGFLPLG